MQQASPEKHFVEAPTVNSGATCCSYAHCPQMAMNTLDALLACLENPGDLDVIEVSDDLRDKALKPLKRMLDALS